MVELADWNATDETLHLLSTAANTARLAPAVGRLRATRERLV
jgi:PHD/YefM family antitoxin component YafN of YafNO toxin-antitoxin module